MREFVVIVIGFADVILGIVGLFTGGEIGDEGGEALNRQIEVPLNQIVVGLIKNSVRGHGERTGVTPRALESPRSDLFRLRLHLRDLLRQR